MTAWSLQIEVETQQHGLPEPPVRWPIQALKVGFTIITELLGCRSQGEAVNVILFIIQIQVLVLLAQAVGQMNYALAFGVPAKDFTMVLFSLPGELLDVLTSVAVSVYIIKARLPFVVNSKIPRGGPQ